MQASPLVITGEKSIGAAASKAGPSQRRRFIPVFAVPAPPSTSVTTPTPSAAETSVNLVHTESSTSKKTREKLSVEIHEKLSVDTSVVASTPGRKSSFASIPPSSPLPRPDFSAKKPRAPRLLTP